MRKLILLGPQATRPNVDKAMSRLGIDGKVCVVTAGWQERAGEIEDLQQHLGCKLINLRLYHRAEAVFEKYQDFFEAHRSRQNRLRELQRIYRSRLGRLADSVVEMLMAEGEPDLIEPEQQDALRMLRHLDRHHLDRVRQINSDFDEQWETRRKQAVREDVQELNETLESCGAVLVAGGHVATLLNRMRLFGFGELIGDKPLIAWSGGAMVLGQRLVLFHDDPPQGRGHAEVLEHGLGLYDDILCFPHARRRLKLDDPIRVKMLTERFSKSCCVTLDDGGMLIRKPGGWQSTGCRKLFSSGAVREVDEF